MIRSRSVALASCAILVLSAFAIAQQQGRWERERVTNNVGNRWSKYEAEMQDPVDDPPDAWESTEFAFARLRYRSPRDRRGGWYNRSRWGIDANKSERQFILETAVDAWIRAY